MPPSFASIVPHPDVRHLACAAAESGYRNVYAAGRGHDGVTRWVAKVKLCGRLTTLPGSRSTMPHVAALSVVQWYRSTFGRRWREALSGTRRRNPWHVRYSPSRGGFLLAVWELGERTEVVRLRRDGRPTCELVVFPSAGEAKGYIRTWLRVRYGLFAGCVMYRAS